jgi:hypothetical protein
MKTSELFGILVLVCFFSVAASLAERWINWKFNYGPRVEQRIEQLEQRIKALEGKP